LVAEPCSPLATVPGDVERLNAELHAAVPPVALALAQLTRTAEAGRKLQFEKEELFA
jgi:hypothetical protein